MGLDSCQIYFGYKHKLYFFFYIIFLFHKNKSWAQHILVSSCYAYYLMLLSANLRLLGKVKYMCSVISYSIR